MIEEFIARWELVPAGAPFETPSSTLAPVVWRGRAAMLKIARIEEEARGAGLMAWWDGEGAAAVFEREGPALLMECAEGTRSLATMAADNDDQAIEIICSAVQRLHAPRPGAAPELVPLTVWFKALRTMAGQGDTFARCMAIADDLLSAPHHSGVLHGDIHHGNILDFGARGWLAIDPKGLWGERAFDFANLFHNPEHAIAVRAFDRRLDLVSRAASLERERLLQWVAAWAGLSAAFSIEDSEAPADALEIASLALARLP